MKPSTVLLFAEYQTRKTKKQKTAFIQQACAAAAGAGYPSNVFRTKSGARNIIVGDVDFASVIFTAHYDTPSRSLLPSFVFPTMPYLTTLYRIAVALAVLVPAFIGYLIGSAIFGAIGIDPAVTVLLSMLLSVGLFVTALVLFVSGPACTNNANANTSGVAALFEIMAEIPEELRTSAAFVFFDENENGCLGSRDFAKKYRRRIAKKLIVNFDCIGVGEDVVVALRPGAKKFAEDISIAFNEKRGLAVTVLNGGGRIPSDHNKFKYGVGISTFKKAKSDILYMEGIYSDSDNICEEKNVKFITESAIELVERLAPEARDLPTSVDEVSSIRAIEETPAPEDGAEAPAEENAEQATEVASEATQAQ